MNDEYEKLLGGYATGTLTAQERRRLFEAALADQALFNALADEQALKDLLQNPHARRQLLTALQRLDARPGVPSRVFGWLGQPTLKAVAGGLAVAVLAVTTVTTLLDFMPHPTEVSEDSFRSRPGPGRAGPAEKPAATKKDSPAKRAELRDEIRPAVKSARDADVKRQNIPDAKQEKPAPEPKVSAQRPASAPASTAPPAQRFGRTDVAGEREAVSARSLFHGGTLKRMAPSEDRPSEEPPVEGRMSAATEPAEPAPREPSASEVAPAKKEPGARPLGLRYRLQTSDAGPILTVEVNQDAYLYVRLRDVGGGTLRLFPSPSDEAGPVRPGHGYHIPLEPYPGLETMEAGQRLVIELLRSPRGQGAGLSGSLPAGTAPLREEASESRPDGSTERWIYLVEREPGSKPGLLAQIAVPAP